MTAAAAVPFLDLQAPYRELRSEIDDALQRVLDRGWYVLGEEVRAFESEYAAYCGAAHCVGLSNGLDALQLVLRAWGIGPGDEVIVPAHTFIATWLAVTFVGATPVPVEVDPQSYNLDASLIEAAVTPRTRAIVAVHLYGLPADLDAVNAVAARHGLRVLEDAAQAQGARLRGRRAGTLGHAAAWSFYPGKNLGALGDAGAVTTNDPELAERVRLLANYGSARKYEHVAQGVNARLDEMQAAVLRAKLPVLDEWNARRARVAQRYLAAFADGALALPVVPDDMDPVWHLFVVRSAARDALQARLAADGVHTLVDYPTPPHRQPAYATYAPDALGADRWPLATRLASEVLSLPVGPHVSDEQVEAVIAAVHRAAPGARG
jgi:dTDP-4-amino-4,6-dideoxygalactose transaminase